MLASSLPFEKRPNKVAMLTFFFIFFFFHLVIFLHLKRDGSDFGDEREGEVVDA